MFAHNRKFQANVPEFLAAEKEALIGALNIIQKDYQEQSDLVNSNEYHILSFRELFESIEIKVSLPLLRDILTKNFTLASIETLQHFLAIRWQIIQNTNLSYASSDSPFNTLCIKVARLISEITHENVNKILMPSLEYTKDLIDWYGDLETLSFNEFVMSDDNKSGLPVAMLYHYCNADTDVKLALRNPYDPLMREITPSELERLTNHSYETKNMMQLHTFLQYCKRDSGTGAHLQKLIDGLKAGGEKQQGTEDEAGLPAKIAITEFSAFLNSLKADEKAFILNLKTEDGGTSLKDVWDILIGLNPRALNCVEWNAVKLEKIMATNKRFLFPDQSIERDFSQSKRDFERCIAKNSKFMTEAVYKDNTPAIMDKLISLILKSLRESGKLGIFNSSGLQLEVLTRKTREGYHLIIETCKQGNIPLVKILLENFRDQQHRVNADGDKLLSIAILNGHVELVKFLLGLGGNINTPNREGLTPLHHAAVLNQEETLKLLLRTKADRFPFDKENRTPLYMAALYGNVKAAFLLLEKGNVGINLADTKNATPLIAAAQQGHLEMVQFLLHKHADSELANLSHETPLYIAARTGNIEVLQTLIDHHANVEGNHKNKITPLAIAIKNRHYEAANILLENGASIKKINLKGADINRFKCFTENLTPHNAQTVFQNLYFRIKNHRQEKKLQIVLVRKLRLKLAQKSLTDIQQILACALRHKVFRHSHLGNGGLNFFKILSSPAQDAIAKQLEFVEKHLKPRLQI